ncbi:hypothetical protein FraQA3DRAFT_0643 [Frankia sp. QA3]|nr:hypothetical protein FraQA3DRAFT_0643 [Frankia sp. QA3]
MGTDRSVAGRRSYAIDTDRFAVSPTSFRNSFVDRMIPKFGGRSDVARWAINIAREVVARAGDVMDRRPEPGVAIMVVGTL